MNSPPPDDLTFEQALAELERIVRVLEDGQTSLDEALARYESGVHLLGRCYAQLRQAEQRIQLLSGIDGTGQPLTQDFEHSAAVAGDKGRTGRPRSE